MRWGITNSAPASVLRQRSTWRIGADTWLREAVDLFRSKASQHDQAMDLLDLLMERRPDDPEPALQLEQLSAQAGDWPRRMKPGFCSVASDGERRNERYA